VAAVASLPPLLEEQPATSASTAVMAVSPVRLILTCAPSGASGDA
jgi:hypothetical protein